MDPQQFKLLYELQLRMACPCSHDDCSCICTFFSIREVKKKAATWMHQGSKSQSHDYVGRVRHANKTKGGGKHKRISDCSDYGMACILRFVGDGYFHQFLLNPRTSWRWRHANLCP